MTSIYLASCLVLLVKVNIVHIAVAAIRSYSIYTTHNGFEIFLISSLRLYKAVERLGILKWNGVKCRIFFRLLAYLTPCLVLLVKINIVHIAVAAIQSYSIYTTHNGFKIFLILSLRFHKVVVERLGILWWNGLLVQERFFLLSKCIIFFHLLLWWLSDFYIIKMAFSKGQII